MSVPLLLTVHRKSPLAVSERGGRLFVKADNKHARAIWWSLAFLTKEGRSRGSFSNFR